MATETPNVRKARLLAAWLVGAYQAAARSRFKLGVGRCPIKVTSPVGRPRVAVPHD